LQAKHTTTNDSFIDSIIVAKEFV